MRRRLHWANSRLCEWCGGSGHVDVPSPSGPEACRCQRCDGGGRVPDELPRAKEPTGFTLDRLGLLVPHYDHGWN